MTDDEQIEKVIAAYFDKHDPHPDLDAEAANLISHIHAAGYEIVPTWSEDLGAAPKDGRPVLIELEDGSFEVYETHSLGLHRTAKRWKPITPPESD